jgi:purine nucleosidase
LLPDTKKVVLVCDTMNEIDDQFAIAYALGSPAVEVLGVISSQNTLVHGSESVHIYREEAKKIVELCGRGDVPTLTGAERPMESVDSPSDSEGVRFLADLAKGTDFSILGTGPATDLAAFRLLYPQLSKSIPVIWAGSFPDQKTWVKHKFGELNARADIHAWRVLYADPTNLVVLPGWPGVVKVAVESETFVAQLLSKNKAISNYLASILEEWCRDRVSLDMDARRGSKVLWDIVNVAYYSVPNAVKVQQMPIPFVDAAGAMYWNQIQGQVPVCMNVDAPAIISDLWAAIDNL